MRPPRFWDRSRAAPGVAPRALAPLAALYARATRRRLTQGARARPGVPVICTGNLNVGGTGKTPTVIALAERLRALGVIPHVLSRGYGGRLHGPVHVDPRTHSAADVGDEPLLLAAFADTWVARDRLAGARRAVAEGAEVLLLDDGFQDPALAHDLALIVVDATKGFGNGRVLPAGPLREPVAEGLARADFVLSIGDKAAQAVFGQSWGSELPCARLTGELAPLATGMDWAGQRVFAFAGIGSPKKFFRTLKGLGAEILRAEALDDHQPLSKALMHRLELEATALDAHLVTTEKDATRLPASFRVKVLTLPVRLKLDAPAPLDAALERLFSAS